MIIHSKNVKRLIRAFSSIAEVQESSLTSGLGLLGAMADVSVKDVLVGPNCFVEYKGAFTEQYVIQKENIYPIEVKAEVNLKSKRLSAVYENNLNVEPLRFSMSGYKDEGWMINIPLYVVAEWISSL